MNNKIFRYSVNMIISANVLDGIAISLQLKVEVSRYGGRFASCSWTSTLLPKDLDFAMNYLRGCLNRVAQMMRSSCLTKCLKRILIPHDDFTAEVVFGVLGKKERHRRSFVDKEIEGLVTMMCEHGVFLNVFKLTQMITKMCRH